MSAYDSSNDTSRHELLMIAKYILLNLVGAIGIFFAWQYGWIETVNRIDQSRISHLAAVVFVIGDLLCGWHLMRIGRELDLLKRTGASERLRTYREALMEADDSSVVREALAERMAVRIDYLHKIVTFLANLGYFGTAFGIYIAAIGAKGALETMSSGGFEQLKGVLGPLFGGMGIALVTTLVGIALSQWLEFLVQVLDSGNRILYARIIEAGARAQHTTSSAE